MNATVPSFEVRSWKVCAAVPPDATSAIFGPSSGYPTWSTLIAVVGVAAVCARTAGMHTSAASTARKISSRPVLDTKGCSISELVIVISSPAKQVCIKMKAVILSERGPKRLSVSGVPKERSCSLGWSSGVVSRRICGCSSTRFGVPSRLSTGAVTRNTTRELSLSRAQYFCTLRR